MSALSIFQGQVFTRKLFAFSGNSLLLYDYLLTLPLEVTHIWNEPWTIVKSLFLINRYGNLVAQTFITLEETGYLSRGSRQFCIGFQIFCAFFSLFSGESIRMFVVIRACAILRWRRSIASFVNILYVVYAIAAFVLSTHLMLEFVKVLAALQFEQLDEFGLCITTVAPKLWMLWLIPLVLDGFILALVFHSLYQFVRGSLDGHSSQLIRLLTRDAFFFYFAALFNVLFSIVCWTTYSQDPRNFLQTLIGYPILTVIGQRLVLNLRRFRARPDLTHDISREINRQIAAMDVSLELEQLGTEQGLG